MGVQSFADSRKTQARNRMYSGDNLLEWQTWARFTVCGGEMAEWLKAMVC
jgi:hypothetical protein